jgi:anaerobic ribonucleoside-triphosphate reductase activating protein
VNLFLSRVHFPITSLGYGRRIGVWFQGCSIRCSGCVSVDTWATGRGETTLKSLMGLLAPWLDSADGITVTGGEPFEQPSALEALLSAVREHLNGDVLVYSGHAWEKLVPLLEPFRGLIDALISDPFDALAGQSRPLRGSDNQRMHLLSEVGRERYGALLYSELNDRSRVLDLFIDEKGDAWFAGIPRLGDMRRLKALLAEDGIEASITQAADDR